jgi:phosphoadenosine phosphosulfate reductase
MSSLHSVSKGEIEELAEKFEHTAPEEILHWGVGEFNNDITLACSFGCEDLVLLDMLLKINPKAHVFYLDTDKHFQETYETRDRLMEKYDISFIQVKPELSLDEQAKKHGKNLWEHQPDLCCNIRKVQPLINVLKPYKAWITGIRRDQSPTRANSKKIEWDTKFHMTKLNPIASWTIEEVWDYIRSNDIPYNPLHDQNFPSIGCSVCTNPVLPGENIRSGRWDGHQKTECGLHK